MQIFVNTNISIAALAPLLQGIDHTTSIHYSNTTTRQHPIIRSIKRLDAKYRMARHGIDFPGYYKP